MLTITIHGKEFYDEETEMFITVDDITLYLEHSLISVSKWESKFEKAFLGREEKSTEEIMYYVEAMILNKNYPEDILHKLTAEHINIINNYIDSKQSATTFNKVNEKKGPIETITSELIYYWMIAFNIPFECETWHLNRLFALIRICNIKNNNGKGKKMSRNELAERNRTLNEQRRAQLGTSG